MFQHYALSSYALTYALLTLTRAQTSASVSTSHGPVRSCTLRTIAHGAASVW